MCLKIPYSIWSTQIKLTKTTAINQYSISGTMNTSPSSSTEKNAKEITGKVYSSTELCLAYRKGTTYPKEET